MICGEKDMIKVSVSSLIYKEEILENLKEIIDSKCDFLHLDIMDGSLTEDKTFNYETIKKIDAKTTLLLDCHLMVNEPSKIIQSYLDANTNILTVHYEAFKDKKELIKTLKLIRENHRISGLSIMPNTKIEEIEFLKDYFDLLLIMSVEIGKYGQQFIESTFDKIKLARQKFPNTLIEVDGGVNLDNVSKLKKLGVDIIVVGGAFKRSENKRELITKLKE